MTAASDVTKPLPTTARNSKVTEVRERPAPRAMSAGVMATSAQTVPVRMPGAAEGIWFLVEVLGFVLLPCIMFLVAYREQRPRLVRFAAFLTVLGIILNRLNVSVIAFNWQIHPEQGYFPAWSEFWISLLFVTAGIVIYRWIANRMPILDKHPDYGSIH